MRKAVLNLNEKFTSEVETLWKILTEILGWKDRIISIFYGKPTQLEYGLEGWVWVFWNTTDWNRERNKKPVLTLLAPETREININLLLPHTHKVLLKCSNRGLQSPFTSMKRPAGTLLTLVNRYLKWLMSVFGEGKIIFLGLGYAS